MEFMQQKTTTRSRPEKRSLSVGFARTPGDILEAQRLRHRIFAGEMGANLPSLMPMAKVSSRYAKHYLGQAD